MLTIRRGRSPALPRGFYDAYTAHHHIRAMAFMGVAAGIYLLNEYIIRKGLGGSAGLITLLLLVPVLGQVVVVLKNPVSPGGIFGRRPFRTLAIPVHALLLLPVLGLLPGGAVPLALLLMLTGLTTTVLVPLQNGILASNYDPATRGHNFGRAHAAHALAIVLVSYPAGRLLDASPDAWPWLYAVAGGAAILAYTNWSRLKRRLPPPARRRPKDTPAPWRVLKQDRAFRRFEGWFMLYGLGFLMLQPVLPIHLIDERGVTYEQVALARGALFFSTMVVASPLVGRLSDRIGVLRLAGLAFLLLAAFPLMLALVPGLPGLYLSFAVYGLAMSGVFVAWSLGPMLFAGERDALPYLNAHLGLVGIRALVGMVGGTLIQQTLGTLPVFVLAALFELVAGAGMLRTARRMRRPPGGPPNVLPEVPPQHADLV